MTLTIFLDVTEVNGWKFLSLLPGGCKLTNAWGKEYYKLAYTGTKHSCIYWFYSSMRG